MHTLQPNLFKNEDRVNWPEYGDVLKISPYLTSDSTIKEAAYINTPTAAIVNNREEKKVLGIVRLYEVYRRSLNSCQCGDLISPFKEDAITHKASEGLDSLVSRYLNNKKYFQESDVIVLVYFDESYIGLIDVNDLLSIVEKRRYQEALYTNPLTGLPGKPFIEDVIKRKRWPDVCYLDISDFKAFNDKYGVGRGDDVLKFTAYLLTRELKDGIICHIGGDDFLFFHRDITDELVQRICDAFDNEIKDFYDPQDVKDRYIIGPDRQGVLTKFPLMTLGLTIAKNIESESYNVITHALAGTKKKVKQMSKKEGKSSYLFERRKT